MTVFDRKQRFESPDWFQKLLPLVGLFVRDQIEKATAPLLRRIEELEARKFCGVHQRALAYKAQSQVTYDNGLWIAIADVGSGEVPGQSLKWQLCFRQIQPARLPTKGGPRPETTVMERT